MPPKKILIVEDEVFLAGMIKARLEHMGYAVSCVSDGEGALELLEREKPDLILMDWMLPGIDGLEVTRRIRADGRLKRIPIVFLTARARASDCEEALNAGATAYLAKPFESDELVKLIQQWI